MRHSSASHANRSGFTVVELIVAISITVIVSIGLVTLIVNLIGSASRSIGITKQVNDSQSAVASIRNDLALTKSYLTAAPTTDTPPSAATLGYRGGGENARTLILERRVMAGAGVAEDRLPMYRLTYELGGFDLICSSTDPNYVYSGIGSPTNTEDAYGTVVYYLDGTNLYRRTIESVVPSGSYAINNCVGGTSADLITTCRTTSCTARDTLLVSDVDQFDIQYFNNPGDTTANSSVYNSGASSTILNDKTTIQIKIRTAKDINGKTSQFTSQLRGTVGSAL